MFPLIDIAPWVVEIIILHHLVSPSNYFEKVPNNFKNLEADMVILSSFVRLCPTSRQIIDFQDSLTILNKT